MNAAKIETSVVEQRNFFGHPAWHFRAIAHTMDTTRALFAIDDQFDSYTSAANLFSLQYRDVSPRTREGANESVPHDGATAIPRRRMSPRFAWFPERATRSVFYTICAPRIGSTRRSCAFPYSTAGVSMTSSRGWIRRKEPSPFPPGNFPAFRVAIRLFDHGKEMTDTRLWLWITKDAAHTPVLVEAEIPFGTARIELTHLP